MKKYIKPTFTVYKLDPLKLFACSDGYPSDETLDLGYNESEEFWENITAD